VAFAAIAANSSKIPPISGKKMPALVTNLTSSALAACVL